MAIHDPCEECGAPAPFHKTTCSKGGPKRPFPTHTMGRRVPTGSPSKSFLTQFVERGKKCPSCVMLRGAEAMSVAQMALKGLDAMELGKAMAAALGDVYSHRPHADEACQCIDCVAVDAMQAWKATFPTAPATGGATA